MHFFSTWKLCTIIFPTELLLKLKACKASHSFIRAVLNDDDDDDDDDDEGLYFLTR